MVSEQAGKRVKTALCLKEIADIEQINPNEEEIEEEIGKILKNFPNTEEAKKKLDIDALKEYTKGILINEKVFEYLENIALNKI